VFTAKCGKVEEKVHERAEDSRSELAGGQEVMHGSARGSQDAEELLVRRLDHVTNGVQRARMPDRRHESRRGAREEGLSLAGAASRRATPRSSSTCRRMARIQGAPGCLRDAVTLIRLMCAQAEDNSRFPRRVRIDLLLS
jgi:hypothetical protein